MQSSSPSFCDYSEPLSPVWLPPHSLPLSLYPSSPRHLPQLPWLSWLASCCREQGSGFMVGSLRTAPQHYHHWDAVLCKAEGPWTSRSVEITDHSREQTSLALVFLRCRGPMCFQDMSAQSLFQLKWCCSIWRCTFLQCTVTTWICLLCLGWCLSARTATVQSLRVR